MANPATKAVGGWAYALLLPAEIGLGVLFAEFRTFSGWLDAGPASCLAMTNTVVVITMRVVV